MNVVTVIKLPHVRDRIADRFGLFDQRDAIANIAETGNDTGVFIGSG
jgi:hypothetical protein